MRGSYRDWGEGLRRKEQLQKTDWPTMGQLGLSWKRQELHLSQGILRWEWEDKNQRAISTQNICVNNKAIGFEYFKIIHKLVY